MPRCNKRMVAMVTMPSHSTCGAHVVIACNCKKQIGLVVLRQLQSNCVSWGARKEAQIEGLKLSKLGFVTSLWSQGWSYNANEEPCLFQTEIQPFGIVRCETPGPLRRLQRMPTVRTWPNWTPLQPLGVFFGSTCRRKSHVLCH